jgi:hypothetical protein
LILHPTYFLGEYVDFIRPFSSKLVTVVHSTWSRGKWRTSNVKNKGGHVIKKAGICFLSVLPGFFWGQNPSRPVVSK